MLADLVFYVLMTVAAPFIALGWVGNFCARPIVRMAHRAWELLRGRGK